MPFSIDKSNNKVRITEEKTGMSVEVYLKDNSYLARDYQNTGTLTPARQEGLARRIVDWYYFTHVRAGKT